MVATCSDKPVEKKKSETGQSSINVLSENKIEIVFEQSQGECSHDCGKLSCHIIESQCVAVKHIILAGFLLQFLEYQNLSF